MSDPTSLTRAQLNKFFPNNEAVRAFERLFKVAGDLTPKDVEELYILAQENLIDAGSADAKAVAVLDTMLKLFQEAIINSGNADSKATLSLDYIKQFRDRLQKTVSITTNYSALIGNYSVVADATAGDMTVTLPLASKSKGYIIGTTKEDVTANIVTITRSGTDLIVGEISHDLLLDGEVLNFISDGTNWQLAN